MAGGIVDGKRVNAADSNPAWLAKNADDATVGKVQLSNVDPVSGSVVTNIQREHNSIAYYVGKALNGLKNLLPTWTSTDAGAGTDNITQRAEALTGKFNVNTGHSHDGSAGNGRPITFDSLSPMTALGDTIYGGVTPAGTRTRLAGNITTTRQYLRQTGTGSASAAPEWGPIPSNDVSVNPEFDAGNSGTAKTLSWANGEAQKLTLTGNCTLTLTNPVAGESYVLKLVQDGTGSRTVTWPAAVKWPGGTAPTLSTAAAKIDLITFYYDGTNYFGAFSLGY